MMQPHILQRLPGGKLCEFMSLQAAESLMQRAYEKACQAFEAKQAARRVQQGGPAVVVPAPTTPAAKEDKVMEVLCAQGTGV